MYLRGNYYITPDLSTRDRCSDDELRLHSSPNRKRSSGRHDNTKSHYATSRNYQSALMPGMHTVNLYKSLHKLPFLLNSFRIHWVSYTSKKPANFATSQFQTANYYNIYWHEDDAYNVSVWISAYYSFHAGTSSEEDFLYGLADGLIDAFAEIEPEFAVEDVELESAIDYQCGESPTSR